jgi:hypothetical protein
MRPGGAQGGFLGEFAKFFQNFQKKGLTKWLITE